MKDENDGQERCTDRVLSVLQHLGFVRPFS